MSSGFIFNMITTPCKVAQSGSLMSYAFLLLLIMRKGILPHLYPFLASHGNLLLETPEPVIASCKKKFLPSSENLTGL